MSTVGPGAYQIDLFVAKIKVRVDGAFTVVNKEAHLTQTAAATNKFVNVCRCLRRAGTLECEISANTVGNRFYILNTCIDVGGFIKVNRFLCAKTFCHLKTLAVTVDSNDVVDAACFQYSSHHQTNRAATLKQYLAVKVH